MTEDVLTNRVAEKLADFCDGKQAEVIAWLRTLGCLVTDHGDGSYLVVGLTGMRCGLAPGSPVDLAPQFGFILAGPFWPTVYPGLSKAAHLLARARLKSKK